MIRLLQLELPKKDRFYKRTLEWQRYTLKGHYCTGVIEVKEFAGPRSKPRPRRYIIEEIRQPATYRSFRCHKPGMIEKYSIELRGGVKRTNLHDRCSCEGFFRGKVCIHIEALRLLIQKGGLPTPKPPRSDKRLACPPSVPSRNLGQRPHGRTAGNLGQPGATVGRLTGLACPPTGNRPNGGHTA